MSKTILVTGGAGFIGSRFVQYLLDHYPEYKIIILDALTYAGSTDKLPVGKNRQVDFWYGNVCNSDLVSTLTATSDIVVHFAAETHVTRSIYDNRIFFETDVLGTQSVANAVLRHAGRIERFIHISTSEVYGTARTEKMDEAHPLEPSSPYAAAKCGADRLVASYVTTYGIPAVIVRPFNTFGPFQHLEKLIPRFITSAILGEPLTIHGDGTAARDFIYVEDVCRAIDLIMHAGAELELHTPGRERVADRARVRHRSGEPVELGHDQGVAAPDCRQRLVEARTRPVRPGEALVRVDAICCHPKLDQRLVLGREVLLVGRTAGVADQHRCHGPDCNVRGPFTAIFIVLFY